MEAAFGGLRAKGELLDDAGSTLIVDAGNEEPALAGFDSHAVANTSRDAVQSLGTKRPKS